MERAVFFAGRLDRGTHFCLGAFVRGRRVSITAFLPGDARKAAGTRQVKRKKSETTYEQGQKKVSLSVVFIPQPPTVPSHRRQVSPTRPPLP